MTPSAEPSRPAAVLWDMDGTLTDTEPLFLRALERIVRQDGGMWPRREPRELIGADLWVLADCAVASGAHGGRAAIVERIVSGVVAAIAAGAVWRPGARELHAALAEQGVRMALVTMSFRPIAERIAGSLGRAAFDVIVTGEDVARGKPAPEAYLLAAQRMGVEPGDCLVIEDSVPGTASAMASGAVVIGAPLYAPLPEGAAHEVWPTFEGRGARAVFDAYGRHRAEGRRSTRAQRHPREWRHDGSQ